MAITYTKFPVDWDNEGTTPPQDLIESGFSAGYKPPAEYFNAILHDTAEAIKELQSKTADFSVTADTSMNNSKAHEENASLHIIDATCTYANSIYSLVLSSSVGNANYFCVRFKAPNAFASGANFSLNGVTYAPVNADFEANDVVILNFDKSQAKCFFVTGGGGEELTIATPEEAVAGTDNTKVMTPLRVKNQINGRIATWSEVEANSKTQLMTPYLTANQTRAYVTGIILYEDDISSTYDIFHAVTDPQGLISASTLKPILKQAFATEAEAIEGVTGYNFMSAYLTKQAINKALESYTPSVPSVDVPDFATTSEAVAGTATDKIMSPNTTFYAISSAISGIDVPQKATLPTEMVDDTGFVTPLGVKQIIDSALSVDRVANPSAVGTGITKIYATEMEIRPTTIYNGTLKVGENITSSITQGTSIFVPKAGIGTNVYMPYWGLGLGKYSKAYVNGTGTNVNETNVDLFIVGNGLTSSRSNAFRVNADGNVYGTKAYTASGADYAEMFEWLDGNPDNADRRGLFVTLDGEKIRLATADDDYILGVVSATPSVVADAHTDDWCKKWQTDIFGERLLDENGAWVLNESFVEEDNEKYVSRADRKEWTAVGMVGKLIVVDDGTCEVNGYCYPTDGGIATKSDSGYRVIARIDDTHVKVVIK